MKRSGSVAALAAAFAGAVSFGAVAQAPKKGGVVNIAVVAEPPTYDCHGTTTFGVAHPVFPHYSTLIRYTGDWKKMAPNASTLDGFASPWNCIYSAAKLKENPRFPETNIMRLHWI